MKNICITKNYAAILAFSLSAVWFLPVTLFAQGAVVGYADGKKWIDVKQQYNYTTFPVPSFNQPTHSGL